jgi:hypothetical protein
VQVDIIFLTGLLWLLQMSKIFVVLEQHLSHSSLALPKHDNFIHRDAELLQEWQENPDPSELIRCYELTSSIGLIQVRVSGALVSAPDGMVAACLC